MPSTPELDPLTQAYSAIWDTLEANANFCALVPERFRIKYTDVGDDLALKHPERDARQPSEYPQVAVTAGGGPTDTYWSSDGTRVGITFQIWVLTGDRRLCYLQEGRHQGLFPVQWEILRAMMDWKATMQSLTWGGRAGFITHCAPNVRQEQIGKSRLEEQNPPERGTGWNLAWNGYLDMWFESSTLLVLAP